MEPGPSPLDLLLRLPHIRPHPGVRAADLDATEQRCGIKLPATVRELFLRCNGAELTSSLSFLTLAEAEQLAAAIDWRTKPTPFGLFPLTENNDSDHVCVICHSPLTGYVVHIHHDDDPRVLFRSVDDFLLALVPFISAGEWILHDLPTPFDRPERTPEDRRIGRELLGFGEELDSHEWYTLTGYRFGVELLGEDDVAEIARLLNHEDEYVREAAERRLQGMASPAAAEAVRAYRDAFERFSEQLLNELCSNGLNASMHRPYGTPAIRVDPGNVWLNLDTFFGWRTEPDGFARIAQRVRELMQMNR